VRFYWRRSLYSQQKDRHLFADGIYFYWFFSIMVLNPTLSPLSKPLSPKTRNTACFTSIGVASYGALGHVPPRLPTVYFFQLTSEPHNFWYWTPCGCLSSKRPIQHKKLNILRILGASAVTVQQLSHYFLLVSYPLAPNPGDATYFRLRLRSSRHRRR